MYIIKLVAYCDSFIKYLVYIVKRFSKIGFTANVSDRNGQKKRIPSHQINTSYIYLVQKIF